MSINTLISEELVDFNIKASTKLEIIEKMVEMLFKAEKIEDKDEFIKVILDREKEYSTGIGMGIAIPHGKSNIVKSPAVAYGRTEKDIDFDSIDSMPVRYIFMIAVPENGENIHLKTISEISRKLMYKAVRDALLKCESFDEFIKILS